METDFDLMSLREAEYMLNDPDMQFTDAELNNIIDDYIQTQKQK